MRKHIPNFLTCLNILVGTLGSFFVIPRPDLALDFVLLCAALDFLDGLAARALNAQSEFGKQLDSLADLVSFGVVPSLAIFSFIISGVTDPTWQFVALLIVPFSALRLARFNLSEASQEFRGLPTPANALMIAAFLFRPLEFATPSFLLGLSIISCFLLVSNIKMLSFKFSNLAWKGNELRYLLILITLAGLIIWQWAYVPFVIPTYIALSIVGLNLRKPVSKA